MYLCLRGDWVMGAAKRGLLRDGRGRERDGSVGVMMERRFWRGRVVYLRMRYYNLTHGWERAGRWRSGVRRAGGVGLDGGEIWRDLTSCFSCVL